MMNLTELIKEINRDLDESLDQNEVIGWINRGLDDLSSIAKKEAKKVADISPENAYSLPDDYLEMAVLLVNSIPFEPVLVSDFNRTGYKVWGNVLSLQNGPESGEIELYYYKRLTHLANATDSPEIDPAFHDLLVLYAITQHQFMDEEQERELDTLSRYNKRKTEFQRFVTQNSPINQAQTQVESIW